MSHLCLICKAEMESDEEAGRHAREAHPDVPYVLMITTEWEVEEYVTGGEENDIRSID